MSGCALIRVMLKSELRRTDIRSNIEKKDDLGHVVPKPLRTLAVCGQGETQCCPDHFQMTIVMSSTKPSIEEAEASVKKRSDYVLQVLRNHGMKNDCIKLSSEMSHRNHSVVFKTNIKVFSEDFYKVTQARGVVREKLNGSVQCSDIGCSISLKHLTAQR